MRSFCKFSGGGDEWVGLTVRRDPAGWLQLSDLQKGILDEWKRPHEIYEDASILPKEGEIVDLTQDVITDCSVVASLCSGMQREVKGFGQVNWNLAARKLRGDTDNILCGRRLQAYYTPRVSKDSRWSALPEST